MTAAQVADRPECAREGECIVLRRPGYRQKRRSVRPEGIRTSPAGRCANPGPPSAMAFLGKRSQLHVIRVATPGVYLDGGARGEILLPKRYVARGTIPGQSVEVFVHRD